MTPPFTWRARSASHVVNRAERMVPGSRLTNPKTSLCVICVVLRRQLGPSAMIDGEGA
jgi:hypothetical protein